MVSYTAGRGRYQLVYMEGAFYVSIRYIDRVDASSDTTINNLQGIRVVGSTYKAENSRLL